MLLSQLFNNPLGLVNFLVALLLAITVHEASHAWAAYRLGDRTAHEAGRLSLNPLVHLDLLGALFLLTLGFGWGKPVPINPTNFSHPKRDNLLSALAGPFANLLTGILLGLTVRFLAPMMSVSLTLLLVICVHINLLLMFFNLLPIPPLDGSKVLSFFVSSRADYFLSQYGLWILIGLMFVSLGGIPIFEYLTYMPSQWLFSLITGAAV